MLKKMVTIACVTSVVLAGVSIADVVPGICTPSIVSTTDISSTEFPLEPGVTYTEYLRGATVRCAGKLADEDCTFCGTWKLEFSDDGGLTWVDGNPFLWPANLVNKERQIACTKTLVDVDLEWLINVTPSHLEVGLWRLTSKIWRGSCQNPLGNPIERSITFTVS